MFPLCPAALLDRVHTFFTVNDLGTALQRSHEAILGCVTDLHSTLDHLHLTTQKWLLPQTAQPAMKWLALRKAAKHLTIRTGVLEAPERGSPSMSTPQKALSVATDSLSRLVRAVSFSSLQLPKRSPGSLASAVDAPGGPEDKGLRAGGSAGHVAQPASTASLSAAANNGGGGGVADGSRPSSSGAAPRSSTSQVPVSHAVQASPSSDPHSKVEAGTTGGGQKGGQPPTSCRPPLNPQEAPTCTSPFISFAEGGDTSLVIAQTKIRDLKKRMAVRLLGFRNLYSATYDAAVTHAVTEAHVASPLAPVPAWTCIPSRCTESISKICTQAVPSGSKLNETATRPPFLYLTFMLLLDRPYPFNSLQCLNYPDLWINSTAHWMGKN